jgi:pimeloyl-ACP methyl ester carboxylesterase
MRRLSVLLALVLLVIVATCGCGGFFARKMAQAPNTFPNWLGPEPRVRLSYNSSLLTNFPTRIAQVGPPHARLTYRVVDPAHYDWTVTSTNWFQDNRPRFRFSFQATVPGRTNYWSNSPRGTIILLHGHALSALSSAPWALRLAEEGWRCVLVNLRGHGSSTGKRIYFGLHEPRDLSDLLDHLAHDLHLTEPIAVMGESYGAAIALRWKQSEPRLGPVIAIAPYAYLANAILNIRDEYVPWVPKTCVRAGLDHLPKLFNVQPAELDTITIIARSPTPALFIAGSQDKITPPADVHKLHRLAAPESELLIVPDATHEALPYYFEDLLPPILAWLNKHTH